MTSRVHMTPTGHAALERELQQRRAERHRTVEIVAWAASNGDRSENADYKEGKRRLRELDRRLRFLQQRLADAEIVDPAAQTVRDRVFFGAQVTYATERDEEVTVRIVGVDEADMGRGTVSIAAPVARALLGRRVGEEVRLSTPRGEEAIEVLSIAYPAAITAP